MATTLLEAKSSFGGRAATDRQDGFDLNQGPHALYVGSCAMRELKRLGVDPPRWNPVSAAHSVMLRDGEAIRPVRGWGSLAKLARADAPAGDERARVDRANVDRRPAKRDFAAAFVRVTTFVADHDALPADVARAQLRARRLARRPLPDRRLAVDGRRAGQPGRAPRRDAAHARRRPRASSAAATGGRCTPTTASTPPTRSSSPPACRPRSPSWSRASSPPGPPADVSVLDLGFRDAAQPHAASRSASTSRRYYSKHSPPKHDGVLMTAMSYAGGADRGPRADRRHGPPRLARAHHAAPPPAEDDGDRRGRVTRRAAGGRARAGPVRGRRLDRRRGLADRRGVRVRRRRGPRRARRPRPAAVAA